MPPSTRIDGILASKRNVLLQAFVDQVRMLGLAVPQSTFAEIARPADACVTAFIRTLSRGPSERGELARVGVEYADHRARLGYDLRELLTELGALRSTVVDVVIRSGAHAGDDVERIVAMLHDVLAEAVLRFTERVSGTTRSATSVARSRP